MVVAPGYFFFLLVLANLHGVFDKLTYDESTVRNRTAPSISFSKKNGGGA
jgi:hypothetical protein